MHSSTSSSFHADQDLARLHSHMASFLPQAHERTMAPGACVRVLMKVPLNLTFTDTPNKWRNLVHLASERTHPAEAVPCSYGQTPSSNLPPQSGPQGDVSQVWKADREKLRHGRASRNITTCIDLKHQVFAQAWKQATCLCDKNAVPLTTHSS